MGYPSRESGLGLSIRQAFPTPSVQVMGPASGVFSMRPGAFYSPPPMVGGRSGPTNDEVLASIYGSADKGRAAQAASIAEAQQRQRELMEKAQQVPAYQPPEPAFDTGPVSEPPVEAAIEPVPEEDAETDGDVIEEVAEGDDEGDSEFAGWGCGMGERPVGVAFTRRESVRMGDVRRQRKAREARQREERRQRELRMRRSGRPMFGRPNL